MICDALKIKSMRSSEIQPLFDQLSGPQKKLLIDLRNAPYAGEDGTRIGADPVESLLGPLKAWLLDDEQKLFLTAGTWNIFFVCATACLLALEGSDSRWSKVFAPAPGNPNSQGENLKADWAAVGVVDECQAEIMERILEGYFAAGRMGDVVPPRLDYGGGEPVHIQFLAAGLRLAMDFNLSAPGTLKQLLALLPPGTALGETDLSEYFSVTAIGAHPHVQATILVSLQCRHAEVHRALKRYEAVLQRLLYRLNRIIRPRFLYTAVQFEITPSGYRPLDFRFSVDTSSALQLFAGNTLYKDRRVFLRELIQNAVDACNLRRLYDPGFTPAIGIEFSRDLSRIIVRDNGIGMSSQWIEKYFLNIGLSFYQSDEIVRANRSADIQLSFISQFGIGFLSSFLVARQVIIKTRQAGSDGYRIAVSQIDDYFDVRILDEKIAVGTEVTVILMENKTQYCRSLEYRGYLKTNVRFLPIKIEFVDENGIRTILGQEPLQYEEESRWETRLTSRLDFSSSQGCLLMRVKENHQYIYDLEASKGGISVFQDGIFIAQVDDLLPAGAGEYVVGRLNLVGDEKCRLSMDRNRLLWEKEQRAAVKKRVLSGLVNIANRLLEISARQGPPENVHVNMIRKLDAFFDFNEVDDVIFDRLNPQLQIGVEDRFRLFIRLHHSRYDMLHSPADKALGAHGYIHNWQQAVVEGLKAKGAGKARHGS